MVEFFVSVYISTLIFFGQVDIVSDNTGDFCFSNNNNCFEILVSILDHDKLFEMGNCFERMKQFNKNREIAFCFFKKAGEKGSIKALSHLASYFNVSGDCKPFGPRSKGLFYLYLARDKARPLPENECSTLLKDVIGIQIYMLENGMDKTKIKGDKLH